MVDTFTVMLSGWCTAHHTSEQKILYIYIGRKISRMHNYWGTIMFFVQTSPIHRSVCQGSNGCRKR